MTHTVRLPKGWVEASLGDITVVKVAQGPPVSETPYIDISSINRETKIIGELRKVDSDTAPTRARQWVEAHDVLVSMTRPNLNAVAMVPQILSGAVASTGFDVLRAVGIHPSWIFNRVRSRSFIADVCENLQGVVYPAIRPRDVRAHKLPIPPLPEQHRIVEAIESYLTRLDDAVASLERVQRNLERYRASVLKAAVEGRLVPTEAELARQEGRDLPAPRPGTFYVYAIACEGGSHYIGQTDDLQRRWQEHVEGKGASWTKQHKPVRLVHWEEYGSREEAVEREKHLKTGFGRKWLKREIAAGRTRQAGYEPASELLERILTERKARWIEDAAEKARAKAEAKAGKSGKPWTPEDNAKALAKARKTAEAKYKEPASPETTDLPTLPEGWCWATADQLAYRVTDGEHQTPTRTESGIPLVSARNVLNGQLSFADVDFVSRETHLELCKRLAVAAGDVLLSCSGTVGRACVVPPGVEFSMVRSAAVLMPALPIGPYMEFGLRSPMLQEQIRRRKTETAQANIFQGKIKQLVFPLPPFAEQEHITTRTGEYFAIAEHIEKGIKIAMAKCLRLRQSILKWAFEGKLVEQDPDDEPASVLLKRIQSEIPRVKR